MATKFGYRVRDKKGKVLEGEIEVFGSDADRVKLDAITLVLWGF